MPNKPTLTQKQKKAVALAALVLFILLSLAVFWFVGRPMVRFAKEPELFRQVEWGHCNKHILCQAFGGREREWLSSVTDLCLDGNTEKQA